MAIKKTAAKKTETEIPAMVRLSSGETTINIVGTAPLLMERFSNKTWQQLLQPGPKMNQAEKAQKLKHNPLEEMQSACYVNRDPTRPTLFHLPTGMLHGAAASIAVDIPGAAKAQIERLTSVIDLNIDLYGIPTMHMAMVRNSGMNRTPDVRTRPAFKEWCASFTVRYARPLLTMNNIADLYVSAGDFIGIGGWRPQKGGSYGRWCLATENDNDFKSIRKHGARKAQLLAYNDPKAFDEDTAELYAWYQEEVKRRDFSSQLGNDSAYVGDDEYDEAAE
jgi:hypothetical protein